MIVIDDILISEELLTEKFVCNLNACKGACCWEGDYGAPVTSEEIEDIERNLDKILPYLSQESKDIIEKDGVATYFDNADIWGTTLHSHGPCAFLTYNELGIAQCGIEKSWLDGQSEFRKPISCHLYPLRVNDNKDFGFVAWNYERWDICSAACTLGSELKMPVYKFLKEAITRYKGIAFYEELEKAAQHLDQNP